VEVAQKYDINVICFSGGTLMKSPDDPWEKQRNVLYDIAEEADLDGLLISGTLCSYISEKNIREFLQRFAHFPVVSLLQLSDNIPSVSVNNRAGMENLVEHLAGVHKYRRFAFVKGPVGNPEADERLSLLVSSLKSYDIKITDEDMAPGDFTRDSGHQAVEMFLTRGNGELPYDVIVCADDKSAYGVIEALRDNKIQVPEDVAVVGFDDEVESSCITPPLTTIRQPFRELGRKACELLIQRMNNKKVPPETLLDAQFIVRESCGCFEHLVKKAFIKKALIESVVSHEYIQKELLLKYITRKICGSYDELLQETPGIDAVITAFCEDVNNKDSQEFLQTFYRVGRDAVLGGSTLQGWEKIFSSLWLFSLSNLGQTNFSYADALLHRARIIRSNLILHAQGYQRIQAQREYSTTHEIGEQIANTVDLKVLLELLSESLPELGMDSFFVTLYDSADEPLKDSYPVLAVEGKEVKYLSAEKRNVFHTKSLLPPGFISSPRSHIVISEPLYFHNELFGIIYFLVEETSYDEDIFEILGNYLSTALHTRHLIQQIQNQADVLRDQNDELQELRKKEKAYLDAIKTELEIGRRIQMSFLPDEVHPPPGYDFGVFFRPAREVSGDFYDVVEIDSDTVGIIIADVSGKDVGAALFMSIVKTLLRVFGLQASKENKSPLETVGIVNDYIIKEHQQPYGRCMFATMFYALLDIPTGRLSYVNAGHNAPLIFDSAGDVRTELKTEAPAIGLAPNMDFPIKEAQLNQGEFLFSYTDGVTEAQDNAGNFFTLKRVIELLSSLEITDGDTPVNEVRDAVSKFTKGAVPFDDITMIGLYRR
jgi:serine phosphatase RsbU (regulator of sigma subunit)/DNA-binding LacI/PurR family transcriptional regulator